jgi:hypothetical protein
LHQTDSDFLAGRIRTQTDHSRQNEIPLAEDNLDSFSFLSGRSFQQIIGSLTAWFFVFVLSWAVFGFNYN